MQKLKMIGGILLIAFLSGCKAPDPITFRQYQIDTDNDKCYSRGYYMGSDFIGPTGDEDTHSLGFCDKLIGVQLEDYGMVLEYQEEVRKLIKRYRKKHLKE